MRTPYDGVTITDDTRLRAIVPMTKFLLNKGANVIILCSHFGRPKGEIVEMSKNGRLDPVVGPLKKLLGVDVVKADDCVGPEVEAAASPSGGGGGQRVQLLENTRFHAGETKNDMDLAAGLGRLADYFVMDAFGTAHRAHSSMAGNWMGLDVGPETLDLFTRGIALCNTIVFNRPMGVFEMEPFALGTNTVARLLAVAMDRGATTIVGGGTASRP